jgi:hypothetical protein
MEELNSIAQKNQTKFEHKRTVDIAGGKMSVLMPSPTTELSMCVKKIFR